MFAGSSRGQEGESRRALAFYWIDASFLSPHDSAETIRRALNLGVNVKMITGMVRLWCHQFHY